MPSMFFSGISNGAAAVERTVEREGEGGRAAQACADAFLIAKLAGQFY